MNKFPKIQKIKSLYPPHLAIINGKKIITQTWQEVPMETTLEDLQVHWEKIIFENTPGYKCTNAENDEFLAGKFKKEDFEKSDKSKLFKILSSKGDKEYNVVFENNHWKCDCIGFSFRGRCKHIEQAKKL